MTFSRYYSSNVINSCPVRYISEIKVTTNNCRKHRNPSSVFLHQTLTAMASHRTMGSNLFPTTETIFTLRLGLPDSAITVCFIVVFKNIYFTVRFIFSWCRGASDTLIYDRYKRIGRSKLVAIGFISKMYRQ